MPEPVNPQTRPAQGQEHPAARAWRELRPERDAPAGIETLHGGQTKAWKRTVYRLAGVGPAGSAVIAKRCAAAQAVPERILYEEVLPRLPVSVLRYHGFVAEPDGGFCWLFLEDAGGEGYAPHSAAHRALAGRWLGLLHASAAGLAAAARLPDRGPAHYRGHLEAGRAAILLHLARPSVRADDRAALCSLAARLDLLAARWGEVEQFCDGLPRTLVHGDFTRKNLRVRTGGGGLTLLPFDWGETAGWAVPAADLGSPARPDLDAYGSVLRDHGAGPQDLRRLASVGKVFRYLAAIDWAARGLPRERPEESLTRLRIYEARLAGLGGREEHG